MSLLLIPSSSQPPSLKYGNLLKSVQNNSYFKVTQLEEEKARRKKNGVLASH